MNTLKGRATPISRRAIVSGSAIASLGLATGVAPRLLAAQEAQRILRIVVPYPAGGASDTVARAMGQELQTRLEMNVVVENRPGASGLIALEAVQKSRPDGTSLILVSGAQTMALAMQNVDFDITRYLTPLGMLYTQKLVLVTSPGSRIGEVKNLRELVAFGRRHAGEPLTFASSSPGTMGHLVMERFARQAGIPMTHVPYKGSGAAAIDVIGGRVDLFLADMTSSMSLIHSGKLRPIAIAGSGRVAELPEVSTFAEQGFSGLLPSIWAGLAAPPQLPSEIAKHYAAAIKAAQESAPMQEKMRSSGNEPWYISAAEMQAYVNKDTLEWADFVRKNGIPWN